MSVGTSDLSDRLVDATRYTLLALLLAVSILPFVYALSVSFRTPAEFYGPVHWIPHHPVLTSWGQAFSDLGPYLKNSALIATGTAVLSLIITIPGAYVFGRKQFPGKDVAFYSILVALLFPYILLIIPISSLWSDLGLYNTIPGLWLAYQAFVTPFALWILRDYFEKLPPNIEEAAQMYGCTQFGAFVRVILPLSASAIVAVGFLSFLTGWNDFLFSNMLTTGTGPRPAVVVLYTTVVGGDQKDWALIMAETLTVGAPPTALYLFARRYLSNAFAVS